MRFNAPAISFARSRLRWLFGHRTSNFGRAAAVSLCIASTSAFALFADEGWARHLQNASEQDALSTQLAQLKVRKPRSAPVQPVQTAADAERHNSIVRQLDIPWSEVFDGLERNAMGEIALTSLEPDAKSGVLRIQAEGRNIDNLLTYAQQLSGDAAFSDLALRQHETNELDPNRPARLSFEVRFRPQSTVAGEQS